MCIKYAASFKQFSLPTERRSIKLSSVIVTDYSWALMHSVVQAFNLESIEEYATRVFKLSKGETTVESREKSWLASCAAHTMHRFSRSVGKIMTNREDKMFACYCFSLLLNCTTLSQISEYFKILCIIFLSKTKNKQFLDASKKLQELILLRPEDNQKTEQIVAFTENMESQEMQQIQSDRKALDKVKKDTIKDNSPFTSCFREIHDEVKKSIDDSAQFEINSQASPEFIQFLLDKYLPYCFSWAGFVFKGLGNTTRITNGSIEKFFSTKKSVIDKAMQPHRYVTNTFDTTIGYTVKFKQFNETKKETVAKKKEVEPIDPDEENDMHDCKEQWEKSVKTNLISQMPTYQDKALIQIGKTKSSKNDKERLEQICAQNCKPKNLKLYQANH